VLSAKEISVPPPLKDIRIAVDPPQDYDSKSRHAKATILKTQQAHMAQIADLIREIVKFRDARDWKQFHLPNSQWSVVSS
jgi:hypothetical protein